MNELDYQNYGWGYDRHAPGDDGMSTVDRTHTHQESNLCRCYLLALEPHEQCPVHGRPWPPRCGICGQMMPWPRDIIHGSRQA